eukprot:Skav220610  [mRNA]  locus=scaffold507:276972:279676:+ [translate_table: standard]
MDVQNEARSLLSAWLRHEACRQLKLPGTGIGYGWCLPPFLPSSQEEAADLQTLATKVSHSGRLGDLEDVRIEETSGALAEDVDVALRLLAQRRREVCEAKAPGCDQS